MATANFFEINEGDLPVVRTRQALLIIDPQNDMVSTDSILSVDKPPGFLQATLDLATRFREVGSIVWVKSHFETSRSINGGTVDDEIVITDQELSSPTIPGAQQKYSKKLSKQFLKFHEKVLALSKDEGEDGVDRSEDPVQEFSDIETFLTIGPGSEPKILLPKSPGCNLIDGATIGSGSSKDLVFEKSHYSAFKSGRLLQNLRGQFVTDLFICGALTNISIFATAMDAARYGFSITLVRDCLGYRNFERHDEALRQLVESAGCEISASDEVLEEICRQRRTQNKASADVRRFAQPRRPLQELMESLAINKETQIPSTKKPRQSRLEVSADRKGEKNEAETARGSDSTKSASDESLHEVNKPPAKQEIDGKVRVKNKISFRRQPANAVAADKSEGASKAGTSQGSRPIKEVSPTNSNTSVQPAVQRLLPQSPAGLEPAMTTADASLAVIGGQKLENEASNNVNRGSKSEVSFAAVGKEMKDTGSKIEVDDRASDPESSAAERNQSNSICEGDTFIISNLLSDDEADGIFEKLRDEVQWKKMSHQGGDVPRLVAVQGIVGSDGSIPIYRHPADESPPLLKFSPTVSIIKKAVEKELGHEVNHCLIQFYRGGTDYISEHSDKTLDIVPKTFIANVSLGAMRTMTFRTKRSPRGIKQEDVDTAEPRSSCKAPLPHNSMCKVGLVTNMRWLHSIRQDKRLMREKTAAELAFGGARISLTFRLIGTFLSKEQTHIWGQGAVGKEKDHLRSVVNGETPDAEKMLRAFGTENQSSEFDWMATYGDGFDVLHISNNRKLFLANETTADLRVKSMLAEHSIDWSAGQLSPVVFDKSTSNAETLVVSGKQTMKFVDNDIARSTVLGDVAILLYLSALHGTAVSQPQQARQFTRVQQAEALRQQWSSNPSKTEALKDALDMWDAYAEEDVFIAGPVVSMADFALWPVIKDIVDGIGAEFENKHLEAYHERMLERKSVRKALGVSEE